MNINVTAEEIQEFRTQHGYALMDAKDILVRGAVIGFAEKATTVDELKEEML